MDRFKVIGNEVPGSANSQILINQNGRIVGSANLTWSGNTLTTGNIAVTNTATFSGNTSFNYIAANNGIILNSSNVSSNYTFGAGFNGLSVGPINIANGVVAIISTGQRWIVL